MGANINALFVLSQAKSEKLEVLMRQHADSLALLGVHRELEFSFQKLSAGLQ